MNKKGLILIFLFVVSTVGFVATSNAATDNKVEVTINYIPSPYIEQGYCWVEFDQRFLDDNSVFGQNDDIYFGFYYDVAVGAWFGAETAGGGMQPDAWYYCPQNNWTEGYTGDVLYNETRFAGWMDVTLDGYDLGMSNFDISLNPDTYQDIAIQLDIGWHYLTITAAELVTDGNHTEWRWTYASDEKKFYVAENKDVIPAPLNTAYFNYVNVSQEAVLSEDLPSQGYEVDDFYDNYRPVAEPEFALQTQIQEELGTEADPLTVDVNAIYNASDTTIGLTGYIYGVIYDSLYNMGPHTTMWRVNDGPAAVWNGTAYLGANGIWYNETSMAYENDLEVLAWDSLISDLYLGQNYIVFYLFGAECDDSGLYYAHPVPRIVSDVAIFDIWIGDLPEETGLGFGILISVSILGLAAALYFVRRRK